jgi:hypothetical protein
MEGAAGAGLGVDRFDHGEGMALSRMEFARMQAFHS